MSFVILTVTAVALGTVGIYFSSTLARTLNASVQAYSAILAIMFVAPVVLGVVLRLISNIFSNQGSILFSPVMETVFTYADLLLTSINPIATGLTDSTASDQSKCAGFLPVHPRQQRQHYSDGVTVDQLCDPVSGALCRADRGHHP